MGFEAPGSVLEPLVVIRPDAEEIYVSLHIHSVNTFCKQYIDTSTSGLLRLPLRTPISTTSKIEMASI
jgi:hypothetical protein